MSGGLGRAVEAGLGGESISARGVLDAIGGWRGVVEALLPATVYLVFYVVTRDARVSAIAPLALAVVAILVRLLRKEPLSAAFSGFIGVVICVASTLFTGKAEDFFLPGFWINGIWIAAHAISLMVGWPLIGLLLGAFRGSLTEWRKVPVLRRAAAILSIFWILVFGARLVVQLPLYFTEQVEALGVARLVMGVPLFAIAVLFTWLVLSRVSLAVDARTQEDREGEDAGAADGEPQDAADGEGDVGEQVASEKDPQSSDE